MPISKAKQALYPPDWKAVRTEILARAADQCECVGECGLHPDHRCTERHNTPAQFAKGKIVLTIAHLNHDPTDNRPDNLRAMCQRCHLRYDADFHIRNSRTTRQTKQRERLASIKPMFNDPAPTEPQTSTSGLIFYAIKEEK